ncbi:MAG: hypothetical protein JJU11_09015 [Candidatus Sumerlaeia bacterium]|nr:hypothetical protein [Candidatus Sumerlaeia bacterium]
MAGKPSPEESEETNARMAMKRIRVEIKRIVDRWDPICLRGLPGFSMEYNEVVGPISVLVRKRASVEDIQRHLDRLMANEWNLPPDQATTRQIAEKMHRTGAFIDTA